MVEVVRKELCDRLRWVSPSEFLDDLAIGTSFPGPFIVNLSIIMGYRLKRRRGAFSATLGVVLPSFLVIVVACTILAQLPESDRIEAFFRGARVAVVAVLIHATTTLARSILTTAKAALIAVATLAIVVLLRLHPLCAIGLSLFLTWIFRTGGPRPHTPGGG